MVTCKECFHYEVCMDYTSLKESEFAQNFDQRDISCDYFKNKNDVTEIKHGTWKLHSNGSGTCDQCHFTQRAVYDQDSWQRFCGVCGARMDNIVC